MRRVGVALVLIASGIAAAPSAHGGVIADPTGRVTMDIPIRVMDGRQPPGTPPVAAGTDLPIPSNAILSVTLINQSLADGAPREGTAIVHPCGGSVAGDPEFHFEAGQTTTLRRVITGSSACLRASIDVTVIIDRLGTVAPAPIPGGLQYYPDVYTPRVMSGSVATAPAGQAPATYTLPLPTDMPAYGAAVYKLEGVGSGDISGYVNVYPCGGQMPNYSDLLLGEFPASSVVFAAPTTTGTCLALYGTGEFTVTTLGFLQNDGPRATALPPVMKSRVTSYTGPGLAPIAPNRVLDTRRAIGAPKAKVGPGAILQLDLNPFTSIDTTSVVMNVTSTGSAAGGFVTVYPCDDPQPNVSNLNFSAGQDIPNLVTVGLGVSGKICFAASAPTDLIADLAGTFEFGSGALGRAVDPTRILDTRRTVGPPVVKIEANAVYRLKVAGVGGIPASATAVTMNVTVTGPEGAGYLTVYPCDKPLPDASNLNFTAGQDVPNLVTVKLAADGWVCLRPSVRTHVIADAAMWFGPAGTDGFYDTSPERVLDTRGAPAAASSARPGPSVSLPLSFGTPLTDGLTDIHAVVMNTTVTGPTGAGYLTVFPCDQVKPDASNLNFQASQDVPNLVAVKVSAANSVCIGSSVVTNVIADVAGFFSSMRLDAWDDVLVTV